VPSFAAAAVVAALALASPAPGQGPYFREVEKDGKVYVFNVVKEYEAFQSGGVLAKPIERLGWGPKGETVVFDSPEALSLFALKYGKTPEAPAAQPPKKEGPKKDEPKPGKISG
jgi:hypothetical protein